MLYATIWATHGSRFLMPTTMGQSPKRILNRKTITTPSAFLSPFGGAGGGLEGNWNGAAGPNKYQYNGKEWNDDFGLGWNHHDWRFLDVAINRFVTIDPESEEEDQESFSPYHFSADNPIRFSDPDGRLPIIGFLAGAAMDYGLQVATNLYEGKSLNESLTNVNVKSIVVSGAAGAVGAGLAKNGSKIVSLLKNGNKADDAINAVVKTEQTVEKTLKAEKAAEKTVKAEKQVEKTAGRGSNNRKPDSKAKGDHSVFNDRGNSTFKQNTKNPKGFDEVKRVDVKGKPHSNTDGTKVPTPHVHTKGVKDVKPALKGQDY
jgi:RHS repeat-associated protein